MDSDERRRTTRVNAGVAPNRFGDTGSLENPTSGSTELDSSLLSAGSSSGSNQLIPPISPTRTVVPGSSCNSIVSSRRSVHSNRLRRAEVALQLDEEISALEETYDQKLRSLKLLEFEVKHLIDTLQELQNNHDKLRDKELIQQNLIRIKHVEREIKVKSDKIELQKINIQFEAKSLERKKKVLTTRAERDKQAINDDDEVSSQHLSDEEVETEVTSRVLLTSQLQSTPPRSAPLTLSNPSQDDPDMLNLGGEREVRSPNDQDLLERLRKLHENPSTTTGYVKPSSNEIPSYTGTNSNSNVPSVSGNDQLVQALIRALGNTSGQSSSTVTEKFLARQVHGRDLPAFSGRPEEWVTFITCYKNTTIACSYDNTDNLIRLQKCLKGDAMKTVQCLMSTPMNVPEIISILERRFGQPEHIVDSLVEKARNLNTFREDRLDCLIEFGMAVKNLTATIVSLNCLNHLNNPSLLRELETKLPVSLRLRWIGWVEDDGTRKKDLTNFCSWMERQTNAACRWCPPKVTQTQADNRTKSNSWRDKKNNDRVLLATENDQMSKSSFSGTKVERKCSYCQKLGHKLQQCRQFKDIDIDNKWKWVRENRICFGCLNYGHGLGKCRSKKECGIGACKKYHHPLLHNDSTTNTTPAEIVSHAMKSESSIDHIHMMIVPVTLQGPKKEVTVLAMLDPGASITLIDTKLSDDLGLQGTSKPLRYKGLHPTVNVSDSKSVNMELRTIDGKKKYSLTNVRTTNYLPLPYQSVRRNLLSKWNHLKNLNIHLYEGAHPKILIGLDHADLIMSKEYVSGPPNAPSAARTELGWVLCGKSNGFANAEVAFVIQDEEQDLLHQLVKQHFSTESFGSKVIEEKPRSREDRCAQIIMDHTIKRAGDRWESGLLWKSETVSLPANKGVALTRLYQMERRMDRDVDFAKQYADKIEEYITKGYARLLSPDEALIQNSRTFYLPHFMAKNPKKPKKLRFVFDAAAKVNGMSLNDALLIGPDQLTSMPSVLFKFRQRKIGISADIEDMFHRVKIRNEDASAQRFLWRGMNRKDEPSVYQMGVLIFGASCSPSCAQEAKNKNAKEFMEVYPEAVKAIIERHYVDDYLDSCDTVEEAESMFKAVREIHSKGGFNICKWVTNSNELNDKIPTALRARDSKTFTESNQLTERVLGLFWKPEEDCFTFTKTFLKANQDVLNLKKSPTKREVLALTMSIYDPLGFLSILTIRARMILQEIWRLQIGWDDEISGSILEKWQTWMAEVNLISSFQIPRCYSAHLSKCENLQLHIFCDASEQAFGAVAYFRVELEDEVEVSLVMSKARVSPLKALSIPRMELQAAVMGSRMGNFIQSEHEVKVKRIVYWSDNQTVLSWLRSDSKRFKQFVAHRVGEIQELTNCTDWRWIPTKENVADEITRDMKPCDWSQNSRWINGPEFLRTPEETWPAEKVQSKALSEEEELKKEFVLLVKPKKSDQ